MTSSLLPLIETMAKEKGVEPQVIIAALEDAMLTASRKAYKSTEDLRSRMNAETGQIEIFAVKHIVEAVENPATEVAQRWSARAVRSWSVALSGTAP